MNGVSIYSDGKTEKEQICVCQREKGSGEEKLRLGNVQFEMAIR